MDKKTLITTAGTAVVTLLVTAIVGSFLGVFDRGQQALTEDQIKAVLEETQVTVIDGQTKTYGEALSLMNERQVRMDATLQALIE